MCAGRTGCVPGGGGRVARSLLVRGAGILYNKVMIKRSTLLLRGVLDVCLLRLTERRSMYGYEMVAALADWGLQPVSEGSIYPLLGRLESSGLIESSYRDSQSGPRRKYYKPTSQGLEELRSGSQEWDRFATAVSDLLSLDQPIERGLDATS